MVAVDIVVGMEERCGGRNGGGCACGENVGGGWTAVAIGAVVRSEGGVSAKDDNCRCGGEKGGRVVVAHDKACLMLYAEGGW